MRKPLLIALFCLLMTLAVHAQTPTLPVLNHPRQVFVERGTGENGADRLIFLDMITGETSPVSVRGERYTLLENSVLYYDAERERLRVASADGRVSDHPFIQPPDDAYRIDWIVSADRQAVAWTVTTGSALALRTSTYVAQITGDGTRLVFEDGPRDGLRAFPVAFNSDKTILYMDYQPDTIAGFIPLRQYAALFSLDLATLDRRSLPGEAGCFCGAAINAERFVRLAVPENGSGFDVRVINLETLAFQLARPISPADTALAEYSQSGDVLISPDGTRAVYALTRIRGFGASEGVFETFFVLVDLGSLRQTPLTAPTSQILHPVGWTEDNGAVLFTSPNEDGTWKADEASATLERIADASYLGTLLPTAVN